MRGVVLDEGRGPCVGGVCVSVCVDLGVGAGEEAERSKYGNSKTPSQAKEAIFFC